MKKLYQRTFEQVLAQTGHPARADALRAALASRCPSADLEVISMTRRRKTLRTLLVAAAVLAALTVGALAAAGVFDIPFLLGGGITRGVDQNGDHYVSNSFSGENPLEVRDGRIYLAVDGQELDLTGRFSEEEAYVYTCRDGAGNTHELVVGGTLEDYGWLEYVYDPDGFNVGSAGTLPASYDGEHYPAWLVSYADSRGLVL